jgi:hypothetical protein
MRPPLSPFPYVPSMANQSARTHGQDMMPSSLQYSMPTHPHSNSSTNWALHPVRVVPPVVPRLKLSFLDDEKPEEVQPLSSHEVEEVRQKVFERRRSERIPNLQVGLVRGKDFSSPRKAPSPAPLLDLHLCMVMPKGAVYPEMPASRGSLSHHASALKVRLLGIIQWNSAQHIFHPYIFNSVRFSTTLTFENPQCITHRSTNSLEMVDIFHLRER